MLFSHLLKKHWELWMWCWAFLNTALFKRNLFNSFFIMRKMNVWSSLASSGWQLKNIVKRKRNASMRHVFRNLNGWINPNFSEQAMWYMNDTGWMIHLTLGVRNVNMFQEWDKLFVELTCTEKYATKSDTFFSQSKPRK